ncbi:MAG: lipoprotein-releasing ABC transporter permease subunit [Nitrospiraceae bacterium]|nr:lipoprotein-releasing ABC transporter permease subunit [Nitrospiraceae bacterium]MDA8327047.1 lipoprotein-releasing ABC transporter permease subunit [Nitrospiraceae bacterium]
MPYTLFIAFRYLKSRKKQKGISFNAAVSVSGVALGVMTLLVVLSVMGGFRNDLQKKILGVNAHAVVLSANGTIDDYGGLLARLKRQPHVLAASPFVMGQVMLSAGSASQGVYIRGIDPALEKNVTDVDRHMKAGSFFTLSGQEPGILLGSELASRLGVVVGDNVTVLSPTGEIGPFGMLPKMRQFRVAGIFEMGMFEYDSNLAITGLGPAARFFGMGDKVSGIELKLDDIYRAPEVREKLNKQLGFPYFVRDWIQMNKNLFSALKLEKITMFIILTFIILVASFNIVSTLMMNVVEKQREIAILKAMGATSRGIMAVFVIQGLLIGLVGTAMGVAGGYLLGYLMNTYQIVKLPADVYYLSHLPVKMNPWDFVTVSFAAIAISLSATIYPAWQAARLNPVEPLRYE